MKSMLKIALFAILLFQAPAFAQNKSSSKTDLKTMSASNYAPLWEKADSLNKIGKPNQALGEVDAIIRKALAENNMPEYLKATLYQVMLKSQFESDYLLQFIGEIEDKLSTTPVPARQILHSVLAELYWKYYEENQYIIYGRTRLPADSEENMQLWDAAHFIRKSIFHFTASLQNDALLKNTELKNYDIILEKEKDSKQFRPTLYDFLANRAADFYIGHEAGLTIPVLPFQLNTADYFANAETFSKISLKTDDTLSFIYQGTRIYQQLLAWRSSNQEAAAFVDADLHRLLFVKQNTRLPQADSLYLQALLRLEKSYAQSPAAADIIYAIASFYSENQPNIGFRGKQPENRNEDNRDLVKAHQWCEKAITRFPDTDGARNCAVLKLQIEATSIGFQLPEAVLPGKEFPLLLEFKNVGTAWFKIVKASPDDNNATEGINSPENLKKLNQQSAVRQWSVKLPVTTDYKSHSADIIVPELEKGYYTLLVADNEQFSARVNNISIQQFWVSGLSMISNRQADGSGNFYVLDRNTGEGLKDVKVVTFTREYDYRQRINVRKNQETYRTSAEGGFTIPAPDNNRGKNLSFDLTKGDDRFILNNSFGLYRGQEGSSRPETKTWFFTDRSIYRPGQIIYFKGLMVYTDNGEHKAEVNKQTEVTLFDVNGSKIASRSFVTNSFGSFNGEFTLPQSMLGGQILISDKFGNEYVRVEEYKRPQFEVKLEKPEGSYKLNQSVNIKGQVDSYSGVPLEGATVSYRIVRNVMFPYPVRYYSRMTYQRPEAEIANGVLVTDTNGSFNLEFNAVADNPEEKSPYLVFNFTVYVTVTDINGETHAAETWLNVSKRALMLDVNIDEIVNSNAFPDLKIKATNLSGLPVEAKVKVEIEQLRQDVPLLHERTLPVPDLTLYDKQEWYRRLPNEPYMGEKDADTVALATVYSQSLQTTTDSIIPASKIKLGKPGKYRIRLTSTDAYGEKVELEKTFILLDQTSTRLPVETYSFFHVSDDRALPGETITLTLGSSAKNAVMLYRIDYEGGIIGKDWIKLAGKQQNIKIPILEAYRGNIGISAVMVIDNHSYLHQAMVNVPFKNTDLSFEFETFRSELLPGASEEWRIKILNPDGKPALAELLAGMYDASLDAIYPHQWNFGFYKSMFNPAGYEASQGFGNVSGITFYNDQIVSEDLKTRQYDRLNWFGFYGAFYGRDMMFTRSVAGGRSKQMNATAMPEASVEEQEVQADIKDTTTPPPFPAKDDNKPAENPFRKNMKETAFFFPTITAGTNGDYDIKFTVPEALTRWNFMGFAHTADLKYSLFRKETVTRKNLMVTPNLPRFFRQGDTIIITARLSNLTPIPMQGKATLELLGAIDLINADAAFKNIQPISSFEIEASGTSVVQWEIVVPEDAQVIVARISAKAGNHTDGEEHIIPVLSNRLLVTETLPLPINGKEIRTFSFDRLIQLPAKSKTLRNQGLTLEFTSNPAWLAVQSLPVLMEPRYDNSDEVFRMYYANALARYIAKSNPAIQRVFEVWKNSEPNAFLSNLEKNQELKSVVLSETPWVIQAASESSQKQRIALLFDENSLESGLNNAIRKLQQRQTVAGGWPWFEGSRESRYITQQIVTGFGRLHYLKVIDLKQDAQLRQMVDQAVNFLSGELLDDYKRNEKSRKLAKDPTRISAMQIYYLYSLSYLEGIVKPPAIATNAVAYYSGLASKQWRDEGLSTQAMIGLWAGRNGDEKTARAILSSLRDRALVNEELGMYWRDNETGYSWYQAPVQTQSLLIELFEEIGGDRKAADQMRTWLIKQKQVQSWKENTATADAVYALLIRGTSWLQTSPGVTIKLGDKVIDPANLPDVKAEAGTGYFKMHWNGPEINSGMGKVVVSKTSEGPAWGALYWQYFENLDKITAHQSPLSVHHQLFVKRNSDAGPVLDPVKGNETFKVGDQLSVRIVLTTDRDLEFVHLKDLRAAGFEPVNQLSGYNWQSGLGYYQTTRDASGDFFFDRLPKGTWVFEYPVSVTLKGDYSAGLTTVQCMYAPEFSAHSEGIRVSVE